MRRQAGVAGRHGGGLHWLRDGGEHDGDARGPDHGLRTLPGGLARARLCAPTSPRRRHHCLNATPPPTSAWPGLPGGRRGHDGGTMFGRTRPHPASHSPLRASTLQASSWTTSWSRSCWTGWRRRPGVRGERCRAVRSRSRTTRPTASRSTGCWRRSLARTRPPSPSTWRAPPSSATRGPSSATSCGSGSSGCGCRTATAPTTARGIGARHLSLPRHPPTHRRSPPHRSALLRVQ